MLYIAFIYAVLTVAAVPALKRWRPSQDYSYGIYINGFLVQQVVAQALPGAGGITNFLVSLAPALAIAALSWHCVERPSLRLARRLTRMRLPTHLSRKTA